MELDAKKRFQSSVHARPFSDFVATEAFQEAAHAAMATMQASQVGVDANQAAANYWRMEGARTYLSMLAHICDIPTPRPKPVRPQNLTRA